MTELQARLLELLKQFDQLCRENDVTYYVVGGELIGILRHKGFIPWDDDLDVYMTRDNWEKLYRSTKGKLPENIVLDTQFDEKELGQHVLGLFIDTTAASIFRYNIPSLKKSGLVIDVFILDPVPGDVLAQREYMRSLTTYSDITVLAYLYSLRIGEDTNFSHYWRMSRLLGRKKVADSIVRDAFNYSEDECDYYVSRFTAAPHFYPKEIFGEPQYVPFEGMMVPIPSRPEDYLCIAYNDEWMYLPRGSSIATHEFCVRSLTVPAKLIVDDFKKHISPEEAEKPYVERKKIRAALTPLKVKVDLEGDLFTAAKVQFDYEKKLAGVDLRALLEAKDYDALEELLTDYISVQCKSRFIGSATETGWFNWSRRNNPLLIDIGDEALYAALVLLMHRNKISWTCGLLTARKTSEKPLTDDLKKMDDLYTAIKTATSAFNNGDYELCKEIVGKWLPVYPDNSFLWKLDLKEKIRNGLSGQELFEAAGAGLEQFPDDPELLYYRGKVYLEQGERDNAFEIFKGLIETTNHGLVLLHIREHLEKILEQEPDNQEVRELWYGVRRAAGETEFPELEETDSEARPDEVEYEELTDVQKKRLELLSEIDEICRNNDIKYSLFGKAMLQAVRTGHYIDTHGDISIVMTQKGCRKFIRAFNELNPENRYLDCMDTNPMFHRFCVRYCASDTLDFSVSRSGCGDRFGIYVTIEIFRYPSRDRNLNKIDRMLEQGWEATFDMKRSFLKVEISRRIVSLICAVLGRKYVAKRLFWHFMNGPRKKNKSEYFVKPFWKERSYYPSYLHKYHTNITFEGKQFSAMTLYDHYLKQAYGPMWETREIPMAKDFRLTRIIDVNVPSEEYLNYLSTHGLDRHKYWKLWHDLKKKWAPSVTITEEITHHWDVMTLCGERYRLWEKYMPMRDHLIELFDNNDVEMLMQELDDYYETAMAFNKKRLGLCFDKQIFEILEYCLIAQGNADLARSIRRHVPKQDWEDLVPPYEL